MTALDLPMFLLMTTLNTAVLVIAPPQSWADPVLPKVLVPYLLFLVAHLMINTVAWSRPRLAQTITSLTIPFDVGVIVPHVLIAYDRTAGLCLDSFYSLGVPLCLLGFPLVAYTVYLFQAVGDGTLSPGPGLETRRLVVSGPYAYMRNPMITGVLMQMLGRALCSGSPRLYGYASAFFVANTIWFRFHEEPGMRARFGRDYEKYCENVGMWLPNFSRYTPASENKTD
ncbi:hypothetical protein HK405_007894 [Cladochytrium tenue]|nr:hypothetical protein HK405_007894 [Cladochytrium tenue]